MKDIIIIGGGPAGLTAAIYAARAGKSVCVIERENTGGQIIYSPMVENYPAYKQISGMDFSNEITAQAEALGAQIEFAEATGAEKENGIFTVHTDIGDMQAKALIIATGASHKKMGVPGEAELTGMGVSYCAVCDGAFFAGKHAAVVGGGNTALQDAILLANSCSKVTVIHRREGFRGDKQLVDRLREKENVEFALNKTVEALKDTDGILSSVLLKDTVSGEITEMQLEGLFVAVGQQPESAGFQDIADVDAAGYFIAGEAAETRTEGLFVAGDVRTKVLRQLTTAVSDGANAAFAACNYLDAM